MTPEDRAAEVIHLAELDNLLAGLTRTERSRWHSLIGLAITEALAEARAVCEHAADRRALAELILGRPVAEAELEEAETFPCTITCFVCDGLGKLGEVKCYGCNGQGVMVDHGPPLPGSTPEGT